MRAADCMTLSGEESVTQSQTIVIKVIKTDECNVHANQLTATWTQPTGETYVTQVEDDNKGNYFVRGKFTSPGVCKLDVSADGEPIKQSPMIIKIEKEGLVNTIQVHVDRNLSHVVKHGGFLLVSVFINEILVYKQSGKYIGTVILPQGVVVDRMYKMKNGSLAFSDTYTCIKVCDMNGQVIKSIGQGLLIDPSGIHVHKTSNIVYVGDRYRGCVLIFDIGSGEFKGSIGSQCNRGQMSGVIDVTITNKGHILILEYENSRLQLFDNKGKFMKVLVGAGDENGKVRYPGGVVVDEDDNIIISSRHKLQLFSSDGNYIKRIDKPEDGIKRPYGLSIISYHPRSVAVVNNGDKTIKIFNY
ncbi:uncharacterized protein LOC117107029 [Anneissia japonica]|uniref:uncharacterized protein LOC117107029 n=1 Tax=Anneissia japonica TaxID=1529436 RepID=UPI00142569C8|nr:uncharacterized protein LOC117107029 [Anneissia japonica]